MRSEYNVFDAHCDTLGILGGNTLLNSSGHFDIDRASKYKGYTQVMAAFTDSSEHKNPYMHALGLIERYYTEKDKLKFKTVLSKKDFEEEGICTILGIEGGEALEGSADRVLEFYNLGVRVIGITWNTPNNLCGSNTEEGIGTGLTKKGRAVIEKMQQLGMAVDVSHMSEKGFYDVAEILEKPFIASHSNSKAVCPHSRNLTDDQFKTLCDKGGVAGINLYPLFLGENASITTVIRHIEHFMSLGGENNIGIGADLDGVDCLPQGISGCQDLHLIFNELLKLGYTNEQVEKIAYKNFCNVFCRILK